MHLDVSLSPSNSSTDHHSCIEKETRVGVLNERCDDLRVPQRCLVLSRGRRDHRREATKGVDGLNLKKNSED